MTLNMTEKDFRRLLVAARQRARGLHSMADEALSRGAAGASAWRCYRAEGNAFDALAESLVTEAVRQGFPVEARETEGSSAERAA